MLDFFLAAALLALAILCALQRLPIVCAGDLPLCKCCGEEPWCPKHKQHYADCPCIGPHNAEELGYRVVEIRGKLWAEPQSLK